MLILVSGGDTRAFTELVKTHWQAVYLHVYTYIKRAERSEEITQDIFLDIWKQRDQLLSLNSFENFLFKITRFTTIDALRRKLEVLDGTSGIESVIREEFYLPDLQLDLKEANEYLQAAIEMLPDRRRTIFKMSRLEGRTQAEIAAALNISIHTVNAQTVSALQFLRAYLSSDPGSFMIRILLTGIFLK